MGPQGPILAALARQQGQPQISAPGAGNMGDSLTKVGTAIAMLQEAMRGMPPNMPAFKDINQAIGRLSRHVAQGAPTAGNQMTMLRDLIRGLMRNFNLQQVMAQQGGGQGQPGAPGGGGAASPAMGGGPSPAPALPGA